MSLDSILWGLSVAGFSGVGAYFLVQTLVKTGIEKALEHNFSKKLETQKTSLKKSEVYFSLQLEALSKLRTLFRKILPKRSHPDMDWHEACGGIADSFSSHEENIVEFLCRYEAVLPKEVSSELQSASRAASDGQFQFVWDAVQSEPKATREAVKSAEKLYQHLEKAIEQLQSHVDSQVGK